MALVRNRADLRRLAKRLKPEEFASVHAWLRNKCNPIIDKDNPDGVALKRLVLTDTADMKEPTS